MPLNMMKWSPKRKLMLDSLTIQLSNCNKRYWYWNAKFSNWVTQCNCNNDQCFRNDHKIIDWRQESKLLWGWLGWMVSHGDPKNKQDLFNYSLRILLFSCALPMPPTKTQVFGWSQFFTWLGVSMEQISHKIKQMGMQNINAYYIQMAFTWSLGWLYP